jgi:hypothetical protein
VTPDLFAQIVSAIGGPGAVIFLWLYFRGQPAKEKEADPVKEWAADLKEIKAALHEIETGMAVLLDRRK